jgi:pyruvate dehydrogenase E1 component alpha subunit
MDQKLHLLRRILWIRHSEEALAEQYREQEMRTPTHFGIGQEAVAVGVCEARAPGDVVYASHRCHNHYLACGGDLYRLAAELYGRVDGCSRGRGGSVHLTALDKGFIISSAILGQTIAVATGSALAFHRTGRNNAAICFFGEATFEEGVVYESMNYAAIHDLPVLFVCENNIYSTESPPEVRQPAGTDFLERARAFKVEAEGGDGNDVFFVHDAASRALSHMKSGKGPYLLELFTYRWREHVGPFYDYEVGRTYRDKSELEEWQKRCPIKNARAVLLSDGVAEKQLDQIESEVHEEVVDTITRAKESQWPDAAALFENTY